MLLKFLDDGVIIPVQTLNYKVARIHGESVPELKAKLSVADKKIDELETKIVDLRISKEELESEALRKKISFEREKDTLLHKVRQDDKVKVVEIDALQQKFASRMSIMENTNKSLHSQLVQTRRERDHHREAVANYENRLEKEQQIICDQIKKINDSNQKASQAEKRVQELEAEIHRLTVELSFSKDAHKADKKLWKIEKNHYNKGSTITDNEDRRITEDALKAAESVQKQYAEYQKLYASEVDRLNKKVKEAQSEMAHKQFETEKIVRELREQIKMLEIDQKNLMQAKEMQTNAREVLQADQERLLQIVQQAEVQKLTRKYKIAAVADQLYGLPDKAKVENDGVVSSVISQLNAIREEDSQNVFTTNDITDMDYTTQDLISQSSLSIKSTPYSTSRLASRQTNPSSYSLGMPIPKSDRSFSIDSNSTWAYDISERRSSPSRSRPYPDPPPSFLPSRDRVPEYDKDGRLHYIPKSIARSTSYDRYGNTSLSTDLPPPSMSLSSSAMAAAQQNNIQTRSTGTWTEDAVVEDDELMASRSGNAGTNILYKIRREELSKGTTPSVRSIAKAFESMDPRHLKRGLFSIRKSRSVDTSEQARQSKCAYGKNRKLVCTLG
uniref:Uncharacterized protein n=1 Tax=Panagrolaimus sp. ES5 TaxID=591445 RepID=A0AC34EZX1_9BILA